MAEAKRLPGGELALDRGREPRLEVLRFGERSPHLLRGVRQAANESQPPAPVALFELAVPHAGTSFDQLASSGIVSRCRSSSSRCWDHSFRYGSSHSSKARRGSMRTR